MIEHNLKVTYTTSRGRDTYGWTLVTLTDPSNGKKYRTCGGGYCMRGTVFAEWLEDNYMEQIIAHCKPVDHDKSVADGAGDRNVHYGLNKKGDKYWLDGGCGFNSMCHLAKAIGLNARMFNASKNLDILMIEEVTV